jgi:hypothetical protein
MRGASFSPRRLSFPPGIIATVHRPVLLKLATDSMNDDAGREMAVLTQPIKVPLRDRNALIDIGCSCDKKLPAQSGGTSQAMLMAKNSVI